MLAASVSGSIPAVASADPAPDPRQLSNQPERLEAGDAVATDDEVVVDGDAQGAAGLDHLPGHVDVGGAGGGVARGVVVQDQITPHIRLFYKKILSYSIFAGDGDWGRYDVEFRFDTVPSPSVPFTHREARH